MRPVIALCAACIALFLLGGTASAASPQDLVPTDHWAYAALDYLCKAGALEGYPEGFFDPASTGFAAGRGGLTGYEFAQATFRAEDTLLDGKWPSHYYAMVNDLHAEFSAEAIDLELRMIAEESQYRICPHFDYPSDPIYGGAVPLFDTAYNSIIRLQEQGLLAGYPDDFFKLTEPRCVSDFAQAIIVAQSNAVHSGNLAVQPQLDWLYRRFKAQLMPIGFWFGGDLAVE